MINFKVVDLEHKAEKVENSLIKTVSNLMQIGEGLNIRTPSFILDLNRINSLNFPSEIKIQKSFIKLPSLCELVNTNCSYQYMISAYKVSPNNMWPNFNIFI